VRIQLNEDEQRFLELLAEKGGEAYLHEVRKELGLPFTTGWKIAYRLRSWGFLSIVKSWDGGKCLLKVKLKKKTRR